MGIDIKLKGEEKLAENINKKIARLSNTGTAMAQVVLVAYKDVLDHFAKEEGGNSKKWKAMKNNARFKIVRKDRESYIKTESRVKLLQDTGSLKNSISFKFGKDFAIVGTNKIYAAAQNFGLPPRVIKPKNKKFLRYAIDGNTMVFSKNKKNITTTLPGRPFMWVSNSAISIIAKEVGNYAFQ